jgi:hypothetical protein
VDPAVNRPAADVEQGGRLIHAQQSLVDSRISFRRFLLLSLLPAKGIKVIVYRSMSVRIRG